VPATTQELVIVETYTSSPSDFFAQRLWRKVHENHVDARNPKEPSSKQSTTGWMHKSLVNNGRKYISM